MRPLTSKLGTPVGVGLVCAAVALGLLWGPLDTGLWSTGELAVFDRSRAELGVARSGLERSPWLPDALRTWALATFGAQWAFRLPHTIAAAAIVGLAGGWARRRGAAVPTAYLAGAFALSFPGLVHAGTTGLGDPIGELAGAVAVLTGSLALARTDPMRWPLAGLAAAALAAAVASAGLLLGGVVPLAAFAALLPADADRRLRATAWTAAAVAAATVVWLSVHQGDGYIPLLGAAKDPEIMGKPQMRGFGAGLQEAGYQLFPWTPLVVIGAMASREDRWPAIWLALAVTAAAAWSTIYGLVPTPLSIPAALCAASAVARLDDPARAGAWRRVVLLGAALGVLVLAKDASLSPSEIAAPYVDFAGEHMFPAEGADAPRSLGRIAKAALLGLVVAGVLSARTGRLGRVAARVVGRRRPLMIAIAFGLAALYGTHIQTRHVLPAVSRQVSPKVPLDRWRGWVAAGALPDALGNYGVRDEGLSVYGPDSLQTLRSRQDAIAWLSADEPRALLCRDRDVAPLYQLLRQRGLPLYVLDAGHQYARLVSNVLPPDVTDENPIPGVLLDEAPTLAHETYVRFGEFMEIIAWEATDPIVRGRPVTYRFLIRALRPLPAGSKLYARFLKGRSSRLNALPNGDPSDLTGGIYPPNLWREGDLILHEVTFDAPWLEIQWGPHELYVGLRRSEHQNVEVTLPEGKAGDFGVRVRDKKRSFVTLGSVEVW